MRTRAIDRVPSGDWLVAGFVAVAIHVAFVAVVVGASRRAPTTNDADATEDTSIDVTPVVEDLPTLKLGNERPSPRALPDLAPRPVQIARAVAATPPPPTPTPTSEPAPALPPLPTAPPTPEGAPIASASASPSASAQPTPPVVAPVVAAAPTSTAEAAPIARADPTVPPVTTPPPVLATKGAADGTLDGTETDPLKAQQVSLYRAQLNSWFSARFPIRGKIAWETLKTLHASVNVTVQDGRRVGSATLVAPSGNAVFDDTLREALARTVGAILPAPPARYADILGTTLPLNFRCNIRSQCE